MKSMLGLVGIVGVLVAAACAVPSVYGTEVGENDVVSKEKDEGETSSISSRAPVTSTSPTLTAIAPNSAVVGSNANVQVTLTGTNLANANVYVDGRAIGGGTASATEVSVTMSSDFFTQAKTLRLFVTSPDGKRSNKIDFGVVAANAPTLTGITPISVTRGSQAITLRVNGSGFDASSAIVFNGSKLVTTIDSAAAASPTSLSAMIASSMLNTAGQVNVVVDRGGVLSAPLIFTITNSSTGGGGGGNTSGGTSSGSGSGGGRCGGGLTCTDLGLLPDECAIFEGREIQCDGFDGCLYQGCNRF